MNDPADSYKVVETSDVTDEALERLLNHWTARGWRFDSLHFVTREGSRRPGMAFLFFTRQAPADPIGGQSSQVLTSR